METKNFDVVIVGGGASGTALLYTLANYTNIGRIALVEKYAGFGLVNSASHNNSQTLHVGDIETNYSAEKARAVKPAAEMVVHYADQLTPEERQKFLFPTHKMVLAVGTEEVKKLTERFGYIKNIFPEAELIDRTEIAKREPAVVAGRPENEPIAALANASGYAVNFATLAASLAGKAEQIGGERVSVFLRTEVEKISADSSGFTLKTAGGELSAATLVVDADAHSLGFAKSLGYGQEFSLIPIAGSFYFSKPVLHGKVYTMQEPRLPFAAAHGDPDIAVKGATRWGPTARFFPVLESRAFNTIIPYFKSAGLGRLHTWKSFGKILLDPVRFWYLARNILCELPYIGKYFFVSQVQKIVPAMRASGLTRAKGFGGMRLQRVDTTTGELLLGEGKIIGKKCIFNMTPSPGASVCLYNAVRDTKTIMEFLGDYHFDEHRLRADLIPEQKNAAQGDTSLLESYAS